MENKKLVVVLSVLITVIVLFFLAVVFFRLGAKTATKKIMESNPKAMNPGVSEQTVVTEKEKIPSTVTGTVASVSAEKIVVKQFANFDLNYEIKKSDVASVVSYQKNPNFDQAKLDAKQQELQEKLKAQGVDVNTPPSPPTNSNTNSPENTQEQTEMQKVLDEFNQSLGADPSLKEVIEAPITFEEIKTGSQINFLKDEKGNGKIVVYPSDMNIGPPK